MPLPDLGTYLLLLLWGGWVAVDGTTCGQFMISRPLVAASVAGWIAGDPLAGVALGVVLEGFHLTSLPFGASRYPEGGPAAVAAGGVLAHVGLASSTLLTALAFALLLETVSGETVWAERKMNIRYASFAGQTRVRPGELQRRHLGALGLDYLRGTLLVAIGITLLSLLAPLARRGWELGEEVPHLLATSALAGLIAGSLCLFSGRKRLFVAGLIAGVLLVLVRR